MSTSEIRSFMKKEAVERFLRYVKVHTTSDEGNEETPSTRRQFDLARILEKEMNELGLEDVRLDEHCYVYGILPAKDGTRGTPFAMLAHLDTSPDQPGENVKPRIIENWDGSPISYPDDPELTLTVDDCPELAEFVGENIITASGKTLLGADDKAGIAAIMSALAALKKFPELPHGEIRVCFSPDEEIGRGTVKIDEEWLPKFCYTFDGGYPGELEGENFDAWRADITFKGVGVHPGYAKNKMVNAALIAGRFIADLPEWQTPAATEKREGFYHVVSIEGDFENASVTMIIRDFEEANNKTRMELLEQMKEYYEKRHPGLSIKLDFKHQYQNMRDIIQETPEVMDVAHKAIEDTGLKVVRKAIRGGTDGARLTQLGFPTPNIFAGGLLFHSRREWIAESSLAKAAEVALNLAKRWAEID